MSYTSTNLDCWRVEEAPHNVLTAAVGCEMKRSEASLTGQLPHKARGSNRRNLQENILKINSQVSESWFLHL